MEQLYDTDGRRKYLTEQERERFLKAARAAPAPVGIFCEVLAYTGCRLSEALALTRIGSSGRGRPVTVGTI